MYLVKVIPITNTPIPEELSYYSKDPVSLGTLVLVDINNKSKWSLVSRCQPISEAKAELRKSSFFIKKIEISNSNSIQLPTNISLTINLIADKYLIPKHHLLYSLLPNPIIEVCFKNNHWPIVDELHIYPTWRQVEHHDNFLEKNLEKLHSKLSPKQQTHRLSLPKVKELHTTPSYAFWMLNQSKKVIIHYPNSEYYYSHRKPYFDKLDILIKLIETSSSKLIKQLIIKPELLQTPNINWLTYKKNEKLGYVPVIHPDILLTIKKLVDQHEKVLIISPRKGFVSGVFCLDCGQYASDNLGNKYFLKEKGGQFFYESNSDLKPARHTCEYCNGTRLQMTGYGIEAFYKIINKNFPKKNICIVQQSTGKRNLSQAREKSIDIVLATDIAIWHLTPKSFHTVFLGLEFLLYLPNHNQLLKLLFNLSLIAEKSKSLMVPTYEQMHPIIKKVQITDWLKLKSEFEQEKKLFNYPPFGFLLTGKSTLHQQALGYIKEKLQSQHPSLIITSRNINKSQIEAYLEASSKDYQTLLSVWEDIMLHIPNIEIKINPRSS